MTSKSDIQPEQADELQAEAEGLKCAFERIEFLAKQGIISESDAACKKQDVIDSFCLAPMLERRRRVRQQFQRHQREQQQQQDYDRAGVLLEGGAMRAFSVGVESDCPLSLPPSPSAGGGASPLPVPPAPPVVNTEQSILPRLPAEMHGAGGQAERALHECARAACGLPPTFGYEGRQARMCAQHRTDGMVDLSFRSPAGNTDGSSSSARDVSPPRTSRVSLPAELREVVPESPADPPAPAMTGDSEVTSVLAGTSSSSSAADALEISSASTRILGSGGGSGGPNTRAAPSAGSSVMHEESLVPEAEPTPATVPDAADLKRGTCEWPNCTKEPHYALRGERARTCFTHKQEDWVHVSRRRCDREGCARGAYFSLEGSSALFCSNHRTSSMVDVVNLRRYKCETEGCARQAYYNYAGTSRAKAVFCSTHKMPNMINVRHRLCEREGCGTTPTYSLQGTKPRFCASHKEAGMVDTKSKMCAYVEPDGTNCTRCRLYGDPQGKATFCFGHKRDGMVNIRQSKKRKGC